MSMIAVGAYLQERRRAAGLTQEDVARRLNITARTVSEWERGRNDPGSEVLARLIELIGATPEEVHQLMLDPHADAEAGRRLATIPQGSEADTEDEYFSEEELAALKAIQRRSGVRQLVKNFILGLAQTFSSGDEEAAPRRR